MKRRWLTALGTGFAVLLVVTGCTNSGGNAVDEDLTVEQAKHTTMSMEREIAARVPPEYVADIEQNEKGVLLSCDADRGYQWTGMGRVLLKDQPDMQALVDAIVDEYAHRDTFTARANIEADGEPRAHVIGPYGAGYLVSRSVDRTKIEIVSFSPCFRLPEDQWAGATY